VNTKVPNKKEWYSPMKAKTTARREYEKASQGAIANPTRISLRFWIKVEIATARRFISKWIARQWLFKPLAVLRLGFL